MQPKKAASDPLSVVIGMLNIQKLAPKIKACQKFLIE